MVLNWQPPYIVYSALHIAAEGHIHIIQTLEFTGLGDCWVSTKLLISAIFIPYSILLRQVHLLSWATDGKRKLNPGKYVTTICYKAIAKNWEQGRWNKSCSQGKEKRKRLRTKYRKYRRGMMIRRYIPIGNYYKQYVTSRGGQSPVHVPPQPPSHVSSRSMTPSLQQHDMAAAINNNPTLKVDVTQQASQGRFKAREADRYPEAETKRHWHWPS